MTWSLAQLGRSPHRLAFAAATSLLLASALWWLALQLARLGWLSPWQQAVPAGIAHGVVMVYGFMPLFFAGFLFTAGPNWLSVPPPSASQIAPAVGLQWLGWLLWLAGSWLGLGLALPGGILALAGLSLQYGRLALLLHASRAPHRLHIGLSTCAGILGVLCLAGLLLALQAGRPDIARTTLLSGLWGFVVATFIGVGHRMLPFFSFHLWGRERPTLVLVWLLLSAAIKAVQGWLEWAGEMTMAWQAAIGLWLLISGLLVLWLALVGARRQNLRIRLLAMLHVGLVWLGLAFVLDAAVPFGFLLFALPAGSLAPLHAITMGFLASLLMAMVTRVAFTRSGRVLLIDRFFWGLFLLLQLATLARLVAAFLPPGSGLVPMALAAGLWTAAFVPWGWRLLGWYGRPRPDGRPG